jgi:hypothetical protein
MFLALSTGGPAMQGFLFSDSRNREAEMVRLPIVAENWLDGDQSPEDESVAPVDGGGDVTGIGGGTFELQR